MCYSYPSGSRWNRYPQATHSRCFQFARHSANGVYLTSVSMQRLRVALRGCLKVQRIYRPRITNRDHRPRIIYETPGSKSQTGSVCHSSLMARNSVSIITASELEGETSTMTKRSKGRWSSVLHDWLYTWKVQER